MSSHVSGTMYADAFATRDGSTDGTAAASSAVILDANKDFSGIRNLGLTKTVYAAGGIIDLDSETKTCSSNAATSNKMACVVTTEALTTAAGATQAITLTNSQVAAGDLAFCTLAGGTNTTPVIIQKAVTSSTTITVTLRNIDASAALNGTVIFNLLVCKA